MALDIVLNDVHINTGYYRVRRILHDSSPVLDINSLDIARRDGSILISTTYKPKEITIEGWLYGADRDTMEGYLDVLKRDTVLSNINLDIPYASGTRRYVVTASNLAVMRDGHDVTKIDYTLKLVCLSPFAINPTEQEGLSVVGITDGVYDATITIDGTAKPNPVINYTIDNAGSIGLITFRNDTTGHQIEVGTAFGSGDLLTINCENRTVQLNQTNVEFEGVFPEFDIGQNYIVSAFDSNTGYIEQPLYSTGLNVFSNFWIAQSFTTTGSSLNYYKVSLPIYDMSATVQDLTVRIETDNANNPSGTLANANATGTITQAMVTTVAQWIDVDFTAFNLSASTKYWIVLKTTDVATGYTWKAYSSSSQYSGGSAFYSSDSGTTWNDYYYDAAFKVYSVSALDHSVDWFIDYYPKYL